MAGFPLYERSSEAARSRLYSAEMTRKTYEKLFRESVAQVQPGRSVILDATFAQRAHRERLETQFSSQGITFRLIEAQADDEAVKQRLKEREARLDEASDARLEDFEMLTGVYQPPRELPQLLTVCTSTPLEETLSCALRAMVQTQWGRHANCINEDIVSRLDEVARILFPRLIALLTGKVQIDWLICVAHKKIAYAAGHFSLM